MKKVTKRILAPMFFSLGFFMMANSFASNACDGSTLVIDMSGLTNDDVEVIEVTNVVGDPAIEPTMYGRENSHEVGKMKAASSGSEKGHIKADITFRLCHVVKTSSGLQDRCKQDFQQHIHFNLGEESDFVVGKKCILKDHSNSGSFASVGVSSKMNYNESSKKLTITFSGTDSSAPSEWLPN